MFETRITLLGSNGLYPKETVLCDTVGYSRFKGIPLWFSVSDRNVKFNYKSIPKSVLLYSAFLITYREFPRYNFPLHLSSCTIYISTSSKPDLPKILRRVKLILNGSVKPSILYSPTKSIISHEDRMSKIMEIRSKPEYIDLFHCKRKPFAQLLNEWRGSFSFSQYKCLPIAVENYYSLFVNSSIFIHIALYYYYKAACLTRDDYIEDAGINLHLSLEAIIKDFMDLHLLKNKRKAVENLIINVWPHSWGTEYIEDLWKSRNQFLAHIDENMFTKDQNICDPDQYCYDTFESITYLITRYIRYKNIILNTKRKY